ncbi:hypothetical protein [Pontibacterium sp.]|uniref:hypothetical protein n=2 Tax=Pontibacterium sp. TaxID=2036026 RepID=UPI003518B3C1
MIERKLNDYGVLKFERFIEDLRAGAKQNTPHFLLTDHGTSEPLEEPVDLGSGEFETRYDLGVHLVKGLSSVDTQPLIGDVGFWSGLALYWFDQLCPVKADGSRNPSKSYNYILSQDYKHRPRHSVFTTWQLVEKYDRDSWFLLSKGLHVRGELIEQLMARQYFLSCDGLIRAASQLYFDSDRKTFKRGASGRTSPGCVYRYVNWLKQIEINYDLFSMSADDFLSLMPAEFDRFKEV